MRVKRIYGADKAGHTGSLDPLATGLLPICLGEATKLAHFLLTGDKCYEVDARLGVSTDSGDITGAVLATGEVPTLDHASLDQALAAFRGRIEQVPPMHSAIKRDGKPLYELARAGIEIDREARLVEIHQLTIISGSGADWRLRVACSKGTYVRSLVQDIGKALGCGATVTALRRVSAAPFEHPAMVSMDELEAHMRDPLALQRYLLPVEAGAGCMPRLDFDASDSETLYRGGFVMPAHPPGDEIHAAFDAEGRLIGLIQPDHRPQVHLMRRVNRPDQAS